MALLSLGSTFAQVLPAVPIREPEPLVVTADDGPLRVAGRMECRGQPLRKLTILGTVVAPSGGPIAGADVWMIPDGKTLLALGFEPLERVLSSGFASQSSHPMFDDVPLSELPAAQTDAAGRFEIQGPWAAPWHPETPLGRGLPIAVIVIRAEGYATRVDRAHNWLHWGIPPPEVHDRGLIVMEPEARLTGRVLDEQGAAIPGASVRVHDVQCAPRHLDRPWYFMSYTVAGLHDATTNEGGAFELAGLFPGTVTLEVLRADRGRLEVHDIRVEPGADSAPDIVLPASSVVSGSVVDTAGRPVFGARVHAVEREREKFGFGCVIADFSEGDDTLPTELTRRADENTLSTTTDVEGGFSISGTWRKPITLYAEASGFEAAKASWVKPGTPDAQLVLRPEAISTVLLVAEGSGVPVVGARLEAYRIGIAKEASRRGIGDGGLELTPREVSPGRWLIEGVGHVGTKLFVSAKGFAPAGFDLPGLALGERAESTLALSPARVIAGLVTDDADRPVAGAHVDLCEPGKGANGFIIGTQTDREGRFRFEVPAVGTWDVFVKSEDTIEVVVERVSPASAATGPLEVKLEQGGTLRGVVDPGRLHSIEFTTVRLDDEPFDSRDLGRFGPHGKPFTETDGNGRFEYRGVRPGRYRVFVNAKLAPAVEIDIRAGSVAEVVLTQPEDS